MRTGGTAAGNGEHYALGICIVLLAGFCLSFGGLMLRHMDSADGWQIMFYRGIAASVTILGYLAIRYRGKLARPFLSIGREGIVIAISLSIGAPGYVFALLLAPVADVMFILAGAPALAAALGWLVLREPVRVAASITIAAALAGTGVMFASGISGGALLGKLTALIVVSCFVAVIIAIRRSGGRDMVPATCLGLALTVPISALMMSGFVLTANDLILSLLLGTGQLGAGFLLMTLGTRHVPAAQVALFMLTESILAPIWVWLFVDEIPAALTLAGGALVLAAVAGQAILGIRAKIIRKNS